MQSLVVVQANLLELGLRIGNFPEICRTPASAIPKPFPNFAETEGDGFQLGFHRSCCATKQRQVFSAF